MPGDEQKIIPSVVRGQSLMMGFSRLIMARSAWRKNAAMNLTG